MHAHSQTPVAHETRVALEHGDVGAFGADSIATSAVGNRIDPPEDAIPNSGPIGAVKAGGDAVAARRRDGVCDVGRVHEHLGGDAPHVQAGAAEDAPFDDRNRPVVEFRAGDGVSRAGSDDDQVEV